MKKIILFILIVIATILFTSCSTQQRVVYRDCNCNTTGFGLGWYGNPYWGWNDPFWGWNRWGWNDPFWGWRNQIVIVPQRFRQITPPPTRYDRRRVITPPTQSARPQSRSITPTPQRRGYDDVYPYRNTQPTQRNRTNAPQNVRTERNSPQNNRYTPQRSTTPQRGGYTPQRSSPPIRSGGSSSTVIRGGRGNE